MAWIITDGEESFEIPPERIEFCKRYLRERPRKAAELGGSIGAVLLQGIKVFAARETALLDDTANNKAIAAGEVIAKRVYKPTQLSEEARSVVENLARKAGITEPAPSQEWRCDAHKGDARCLKRKHGTEISHQF